MPAFMPTGASLKALVLCSAFVSPLVANAQDNPYRITELEKAACEGDAQKLCADAWPDESRLIVCMKANEASLGANCQRVFVAGMKRRGLDGRGIAVAPSAANRAKLVKGETPR